MKRLLVLLMVFVCSANGAIFAQTSGRWTHQIGVEVGPQYAFDATATASDQQKLMLRDVGVGFGLALNYYYRFDRSLFLSISGAVGVFGNGYFRRQNADGSFPVLNTFYFQNNPLVNYAFTGGLRYNFALSGFQPYLGLEAGTYFIGGGGIRPEGSQTTPVNLAVTPKAGFRYQLQPGLDLDASVKLIALISGYVPFSYASVNIGVSYALNFQSE